MCRWYWFAKLIKWLFNSYEQFMRKFILIFSCRRMFGVRDAPMISLSAYLSHHLTFPWLKHTLSSQTYLFVKVFIQAKPVSELSSSYANLDISLFYINQLMLIWLNLIPRQWNRFKLYIMLIKIINHWRICVNKCLLIICTRQRWE